MFGTALGNSLSVEASARNTCLPIPSFEEHFVDRVTETPDTEPGHVKMTSERASMAGSDVAIVTVTPNGGAV